MSFGTACDLAQDPRPVGGEAGDAEPLAGDPPRAGGQLGGLGRIGEQAPHVREQAVEVGLDVAVDAALHGGAHLGGGEAEDRQADHHRLAHGQAEAGVADRVEEEAVAAEPGVELAQRQVAEAAERGRVHAGEVERDVGAHAVEHVAAEPSPAPREVVDDDDAARELAAVDGVVGDDDAVLDDPHGGAPGVPHQGVERGDVDEQDVGVVDGVAGVGRRLARRIVLEVDARQAALGGAEDLELIALVVAARLEQDDVEWLLGDGFDRDLVDVGAPGEAAAAPAVALGTTWLYGQVELVRGLGEVVEVAAVNVPGQDAESSHEGLAFALAGARAALRSSASSRER
ncbi:hypothetical protein OV079_16390 [Nannocystis pusilla]|uniref:Uncharacterized protein n=1 Tax=Nannocystis pusilla TaxID=889268 RepID=A0A9X3IXL3_9BACT|nr:hypothetical protein [Nannocystis pusilla]MCY1007105.1 hypothetical protein [Nannocystis pusilla]